MTSTSSRTTMAGMSDTATIPIAASSGIRAVSDDVVDDDREQAHGAHDHEGQGDGVIERRGAETDLLGRLADDQRHLAKALGSRDDPQERGLR